MKLPLLDVAKSLLSEAEKLNPGPWVSHSQYVAKGASAIASIHAELDPNVAYIIGLLHDIGRREGVTAMRHILDGYTYLQARQFDDAARICLTHSFPVKNINMVATNWDCTEEEKAFISTYLNNIEYTKYDLLIQLCDSIALPSGFCLIEKRLLDVALRKGVDEYTIRRWKKYLEIKSLFDDEIGQSIYSVLDGVVENTFGF